MAAVGIRMYIYRGEAGEVIPDDGTYIIVSVHEDVTVILAEAFINHPSIATVICHEGVEKIEEFAFQNCPSLRRVTMPGVKIVEQCAFQNCPSLEHIIMPGVEVVERRAFSYCEDLTYVDCGKLEVIKENAFVCCKSLRGISTLSVRIIKEYAFDQCRVLSYAIFGTKLERIERGAFCGCRSLERLIIPLKDGLVIGDAVFQRCECLSHVKLLDEALHETIPALLLKEWRNDMTGEIDSINQILPNTFAGNYDEEGDVAHVIRRWIRSLLIKIIHYQAEHQRFVNEASSTLHHALPHDIVANKVLPFLELPSYTFEVEDD